MEAATESSTRSSSSSIHVAHIGNSIQYYNDCPRLLERMLRATAFASTLPLGGGNDDDDNKDLDLDKLDLDKLDLDLDLLVHQDSCLRGGATLTSLWRDGNGMLRKFSSRPKSKVPLPSANNNDIGAPTVRDLLLNKNKHKNNKNNDDDDDSHTPPNKYWDFIVINDHTQSPVRDERKEESKIALENEYLPTIVQGMKQKQSNSDSSATTTSAIIPITTTTTTTITTSVVFVQTAAYKSPVINDSSDLGSFDDFTNSLIQGYDEYVDLVKGYNDRLQQQQQQQQHKENANAITVHLKATLAPLGIAYRMIRQQNYDMWSKLLYANDDFHPSPHGTLLQACLLHCIVSGGTKFELFGIADDDDDDIADGNGDGDGSVIVGKNSYSYSYPSSYLWYPSCDYHSSS